MTEEQKRAKGRPSKKIDLVELRKIMVFNPPRSQIAAYFNIHPKTLSRMEREDPEITDEIERGYENAKLTLRRLQWQAAYDGKVPMLIWLGKQWLGQTDKQEVTSHNTNVEVNKSDEQIITDFLGKSTDHKKQKDKAN